MRRRVGERIGKVWRGTKGCEVTSTRVVCVSVKTGRLHSVRVGCGRQKAGFA